MKNLDVINILHQERAKKALEEMEGPGFGLRLIKEQTWEALSGQFFRCRKMYLRDEATLSMIHGNGGKNLYLLCADGSIRFSENHAHVLSDIDKARKLGFAIFWEGDR